MFSDAHDAVLVPLYWNSAVQPLALPVHTAQQLQPRADSNMRPAPTAPPAPSTPCTSSSQMLQASPALEESHAAKIPSASKAAPATSSSHLDNSAVQPVALPVHPEKHLQPPAASNVRPAPKTPTAPSAPCASSSQKMQASHALEESHAFEESHALEDTMSEAPSLNIPCADKPLYAQLVHKLALTEDQDLMHKIAKVTLFERLSTTF